MPNPPAAPNFAQAAQQQGAANLTAAQQQARLNNPNFQGIGGSQTVTFNADGTPRVTQSLDPSQQALYNQWTGNQAQAGQAASGGPRWGTARAAARRPEIARLANGRLLIEAWDDVKSAGAPLLKRRRA